MHRSFLLSNHLSPAAGCSRTCASQLCVVWPSAVYRCVSTCRWCEYRVPIPERASYPILRPRRLHILLPCSLAHYLGSSMDVQVCSCALREFCGAVSG